MHKSNQPKPIRMKKAQKALATIEPKNPIGRPREWTKEYIEQKRQLLEKWIDNPKNYFFTTFLNEADLHHEHIERFCNYSPEFRATHARALKIQEARLVDLAVSRKGDGNFIKFIMANKCGWKEKSEVSGDGVNPLAIIMARIADSAKDPLDYDG
jgi:hypothetical protein